MREDTVRNDQPLDLAWTTKQSDGYGSGPEISRHFQNIQNRLIS